MLESRSVKRIPILYLGFGILVLVSVVPLLFFGAKLISINRQALETNEQELQNTIARSIAEEITLYDSSFRQQLQTLSKTFEGIDLSQPGWDTPFVRTTLEQFVGANVNLLYVTLLNDQGKGIKAGNYNADADPFLRKVLERAFIAARQGQPFAGEPVLMTRGRQTFPVSVFSQPLGRDGHFRGMLAIVADLNALRHRLRDSSLRGLDVYVVDHTGRLMLHPDLEKNPIGTDLNSRFIVQRFVKWKGQALASETTNFEMETEGQKVAMLGTYCAVPSLQWAVIAQKRQKDAYVSVDEMKFTTFVWGVVALLACLVVGYYVALRITNPIVRLTESSRAIARGDFSRRILLESRTEIGELAKTFNTMTDELERYVEQLKRAAEENHELFMASIRMIAAAVDEKDPYTHGHAERVTKYSTLIATEMGLPEEEVQKLRISALLHDVGKIGIDDRVLKKPGALTPDEYDLMKQHTVKGANIVRGVLQLREMIPGIELHHESLDGRGYPHGLRGDGIPLMARIIAVADTFDAMTTHRPYQTAMEPSVAISYLLSQAGKRFDPECAKALQSAYESGKLKLQRVAAVLQ